MKSIKQLSLAAALFAATEGGAEARGVGACSHRGHGSASESRG